MVSPMQLCLTRMNLFIMTTELSLEYNCCTFVLFFCCVSVISLSFFYFILYSHSRPK
uniref:Uncharacterized protein n=1 Tax=Arundo donax TaxID=35708 RepID=A0A0A9TQQ4_ARUDO